MLRWSIARLSGLAALAVFLIAAGAAQAGVVAHKNSESASAVRKYWTADRMRDAIPLDRTDLAGTAKSKGKPGGGGGNSWASVEVLPGSAATAHGKVFFTDNRVRYVCSGTALQGDVVWTAGHCVNEGPGAYFTNFLFVPAYRDGTAPYGEFPASTLLTTNGWSGFGQFGVDEGAAKPSTNGAGNTLSGAGVDELTIAVNQPRQQNYRVYGYPAAKPFNGQRLRVCNTTWSLDDTSANPATMGVQCDMTGGSSGGAWVISPSGAVASNVSYGYNSLKNVLFGPHFEGDAQQLYNNAVAATP